jgi:GT2 family glycosyltransferase
MVQAEFPAVQLIVNRTNSGYSAGNNLALRHFGFGSDAPGTGQAAYPRFVLLLNPDTVVPPTALDAMARFLQDRPTVGVAGPRVRRPDGSLDLACRRSFPTPQVSFYRMVGLSKLFPKSRRFNAYNLEYLPEDAVHPVDSVVGAFMLLRREAIVQAGLLDERFFMYGEDLDWAKRIKDAGWEIWYNGQVEITHVKQAASRQSAKSRIDFYEAMWLFYRKHYRAETAWWVDRMIALGIALKGGASIARHLWAYCAEPDDGARTGAAAREVVTPAVPARTGVDGH